MRSWLVLASAAGFALLGASPAAWAACSNNNPANGETVNCTGTDNTGVGNGTQSNVTVNVQPGATITRGVGVRAINLGDTNNTVTNSGTISVGSSSRGISVGDDNNTVTNLGVINAGIGGVGGFGISAGDNNTLFNSGTITAGDQGRGLFIGSSNTFTNNGKISVGDDGYGLLGTDLNSITNNGTISVGASTGIHASGINVRDSNNVWNYGTITVGDGTGATPGYGIAVQNASKVFNFDSISTGAFGQAIRVDGTQTEVTNQSSGTITVSNGIGIAVNGTANTVTNYGSILVTNGGIGVQFLDSSNTLNNYGTIKALGNGNSAEACFCTTNNVFNNYGVLDGKVTMVDTATKSHTLNNYGLITITDSLSGTPLATHGIDGLFNQTAAGILELRVTNATNGNDSLFSDTATIHGTLRVAPQPFLYGNTTTYSNVFTTGTAVITPFDNYTSKSPFFSVTPTYDSGNANSYNAISLTLTRIPFGSVPGLTPNESAVGKALEASYSTGLTGNAATLFSNLFAATSITVLDQLSGVGLSASQDAAFGAGGGFIALFGPAGFPGGSTGGAPLGYASADKPSHPALGIIKLKPQEQEASRWQVWGSGFGGTRTTDGEPVSPGNFATHTSAAGGAFGVSYRPDADSVFGAAVGVSRSHFSVGDVSTSGDATAGHFGLNVARRWGAWYANGALAYTHLENDTTRTITGIGPTETATGRFAGDMITARLEVGWRQELARFALTPFAAAQFSQLWQQGFSEASTVAGGGAGVLGLTVASRSAQSTPVTLGAQADTRIELGNGSFAVPYARLGWLHEFMPDRTVTASFISVPAATFTVAGARASVDAAALDTGVKIALNERTELKAGFSSEIGDRSRSYAGTGEVRINW